MPLTLEVRVRRGPIQESRHRIEAAACGPDGSILAATAEPGLAISVRSAAKPFQLVPLVERGHADRWGWSDEDLALMAASHSGSAWHVERVARMLGRMGLEASALACGYHDPFDGPMAAHLQAHPEERSRLYNNCSGKHAGMLCLALSEGWPVAGYADPRHPVQRLMRETVAGLCGLATEAVAVGVDGCGVSAFEVPLAALARGYAVLAAARADGDARQRALVRVRDAMRRHPAATAGRRRFSTVLMEICGGRLVSKVGAEGLECVAVPGRGLGVAVKVVDGNGRASAPAVVALLARLGVLSSDEVAWLTPRAHPRLRNHAGDEVGSIEAVLTEEAAVAAGR